MFVSEKLSIKIFYKNFLCQQKFHLGKNIAEAISNKRLFASANTSAIADCRGEFRGLYLQNADNQNKNSLTTLRKENFE